MSNTFAIQTYLPASGNQKLVIDIATPASNSPAFLEVNSPTQHNSQLWEAVEDQKYLGYFRIKSLQANSSGKKQVIDIQGVSETKASNMAPDTSLIAFPEDTGWHLNQLWTVALNPASTPNVTTSPHPQTDSIFIQSYLTNSSGTPFVIDIRGWKPGTTLNGGGEKLDAFRQKTTNTENQLWTVVPQNWGTLAPKVTAFKPYLNLTSPLQSTFMVQGTGFRPGATLVFTSMLVNNEHTQPTPILGVSDFAGNFSMTASMIDWGLGSPAGNQLASEAGEFEVGVAYNSGTAPQAVIASAKAQWSGSEISNFSN